MPPYPAHYEPAMREALDLALRGRFYVAPNPCVGAVLLRDDGTVAARGWHERYGEAHAEVNALKDAKANGVNPADCTMVVTLEPCSHHGKTPPCADAILEAGIRRVVIGSLDPTPEARGGAQTLRKNGVEVVTGVLQRQCDDLIAEFITWKTTDLPYTILKLASTLDGRIATRTGHSRWISCPETLRLVHEVRRHAGAILVGGNTFYHDDPRLTCRPGPDAPPAERQPFAVVVTSRLPDPGMQNRLLKERPTETIFWTTIAAAASPKAENLRKMGVEILGLSPLSRADNTSPGYMRAELDLREGLAALRRDHGCLYVMCEGGGRLGLSLLEKNLAGEMHLHLSPRILADNEATPLFSGLSPLQIDDGVSLRILSSRICGEDLIVTLRPGDSPGCRPATA
ncbi:MAG: bifunctional diaminohydroxyphosphoribosylaminopyrimidine deaminase/5-amino-6-(5-phosphoribosylamino)uracil reductase RibD [Deltaproteobacteria bacterium]|nr:bifunctional diaminohydroxyphosphoribosylaminopyrimidine deaminase/5-amino-6-(5-phosphoribosylamino)uracil reductase RibD [Deltaproteobacteria bacterium]